MKLDDNDLKIVRILQNNARETTQGIAQQTGMRPSTVHLRIKRLRERGVITRFTIELDDTKIGQDFVGFIFLTTNENLPKKVFDHPSIKEVYGVTGEYDLMIKMKCKDVKEFNQFLLDLRKNKAVTKTLSEVATLKIKEVL